MSRTITDSQIQGDFNARYPSATQPGQVDSISASGDPGQVDSIQASSFKGFAAVAGKLQWVQAIEHFFQKGELILKDDFVQVIEEDARRLFAAGRAMFATDAQVAQAQTAAADAPAATNTDVAKAQSGKAA